MALTWAGPFGAALSQSFSEEESRQRTRDEEKQRTRMLRQQAEAMERQAQIDLYLRQAGVQPLLNQPPGPQPPQPGQPSAPATSPPGMQPPQGGLQPPPTGQPIQMPPGQGAGPPGMPGTPAGPAPMRPYSAPGQGPAAGAMPPPQAQQQDQLGPPPPTPDQVLSQQEKRQNSPMKMFQTALAQLEKSHPRDPRNTEAALRYVEKFKPIFDAERQDELALLRVQHEADQVAMKTRDQFIRDNYQQGKLGIDRQREARLAEMLPTKQEELRARTDLEKVRAGKLRVDAQNGVALKSGQQVPGEDLAAYNYLYYRQLPALGMGGKQERMQIVARAEQLAANAGLDPGQAAALSGEKKADLASLNNMVRWRDGVAKSEEAVKKAMTIVKDYQSRLNLSTSQDLNAMIVEAGRRLGNKDAQPFINAITTVQNEYARVLSGPTSNATLREGAVERAGKMLATGITPDQLDETFIEMKRQMDAQVQSTDEVIDQRRQSFQQIGNAAPGKVVDFASLPK